MPEKIYSFNGKDITMNVCIQIRDVLKLLQERFEINFEEAVLRFINRKHIKRCRKQKTVYGQNRLSI